MLQTINKTNWPFCLGLSLLISIHYLLFSPVFAQTTSVENVTEEAASPAQGSSETQELEGAELWAQRQTEIEQLYQEGQLEEALNLSMEAVSLADLIYGTSAPQTLNSLLTQALLHSELDQLEEANQVYQYILETSISALGEKDPMTLSILDSYGEFLNLIDSEVAEPFLRKALVLSNSEDPQRAFRMQALGLNLIELGQVEEAETLITEALQMFERIFGQKDPDTLSAMGKLAQLYLSQVKLDKAQQLLETALPLMLEILGDVDISTLETTENLAEIHRLQGNYGQAESLFLQTLQTATSEFGEEDPLVVQTMSHLAQLYEDTGKLKDALAMHQRVYEIDAAVLGEDHPNTASDLNNLASVNRRLGNSQKAEKLFRESLKIMTAAMDENSPQTLSIMNNLALILENQGLYDEAEPLFKKAFALSKKLQGEKHPTTLALLNNLAFLYESQGDFKRSEINYKAVIQLNNEVFGETHSNTLANQNNLAYLYLRDQRFVDAEPIFAHVYKNWSKQLGANHQNTLKALNNLGRVHKSLGNIELAEQHLTAALAGRQQIFGKKHSDTLRSMNDMGELYVLQKKLEKALEMFQETLKLEEEVLGPNHPYTFETLNNLAQLLEQMGQMDEAYKVYKTGFERRDAFFNRVLWVAGDNTRQSYIQLHKPEQDSLIRMLLGLNDVRTARDIFNISLSRKGLLLKITSETQQVLNMSKSSELQEIAESLTQVRKKLASLTLAGPTDENRDNFGKLVYDLEEKVNAYQLELGEKSQRFRESTRQISVDQVVEGMGETALVDFLSFRAEDDTLKILAIVANQGEFNVVQYEDLFIIQDMIMELREIIQDEGAEDEDVKVIAYELWTVLWEPLNEYLGDATSVFVSPDSVLNVLPFDVLTDDSDSYLIENIDLRIISSARDLATVPLEPSMGEMLIIAGPDYDSDKILKSPEARNLTSKRSRSVAQGARMGSGMRGLNFDPLPGAEKEGEIIKEVSEGKERQTNIYSKREAEENLFRKIETPPEVLHIATHGFFLKKEERLAKRIQGLSRGSSSIPPPADNPLLRAGLAFAGLNANAPLLGEIDTDNDGVLTAMEVLSLNLDGTRLVVLSACETGLGEIHEGEGVYGLRRSFQEAGVDSIINSFWEVSDAGTQLLMTKFYDKFLTGIPARQAMREARLEMLDDVQWSAPFYWSAFVLVGRNS